MRCLVVGGSGQDGILVAAQLLVQGRRVVSVSRRPSPLADVESRTVDVFDRAAIDAVVADLAPDEVYFLAAHHRSSQDAQPSLDADIAGSLAVNAVAFASLLESLALHAPRARTVYASSCRVFGLGDGGLLDESAAKSPVCPYGVSKVAGMSIADVYRRERGLFVSSAILFHHESELRPSAFLSKKLALAAIAARNDPSVCVRVGSLDDVADWGCARDYAAAMRCILQVEEPGEFVVASGRLRSVREFADACFGSLGLDWSRHVVSVAGSEGRRWRLRGDAGKLSRATGWQPTVGFEQMVRELVGRTERHDRQRPADFHSYL